MNNQSTVKDNCVNQSHRDSAHGSGMSIEAAIHFYGTQNLTLTHQFYHEFLGLKCIRDQIVCRIYEITPTAMIGFCEHIEVVCQNKSPIITLVVHDVWAMYEHVKKVYGYTEKPTVNHQFMIEHFFMSDPNGYTLEIQRFL